MFSGIVESCQKVVEAKSESGLLRIRVARPASFDDLHSGDSVCTNGVCLTVEAFDERTMQFALGAETLAVTGWTPDVLLERPVNLERSLRVGDRIHGHMVSGHVDAAGTVTSVTETSGSVILEVRAPETLLPYLWKKGSWAVNGVSLTINDVNSDIISVCLIPETVARTNLGLMKPGSRVNLEADMWARGMVHALLSRENPAREGMR
jgi:riboflavin synthase